MNNPFLIGNRLYLRGLEASDVEGQYPTWLNNEILTQYLEHHVYPYSKASALEYIHALHHRSDMIMLAMIDRSSDRHIGNITLSAITQVHRSAEFSLLIGEPSAQGKGLAKEASLLLLHHGFGTMNLNRIWCGTMDSNLSMQKLAVTLGMQQEGIKRQEVYKNGRYYDTLQYSILKDEFYAKYPKI
ncbi:GNAT family N-acetyltransferase [Sulfuricurvum sp.]|uniref:GNAT family N-acetyltransferase n=1 Tax=Sulfuricurvum sp. TaxID=2025608 RepID=UPI003BAEFE69